MDDDISQILKDFGVISGAYKKCIEEKHMLSEEIKSLNNKFRTNQNSEKNQNEALLMSRKLIAEQQTIISKLVNVKEEIKACHEEISKKNEQIQELQEEKSVLFATFQQEKDNIIRDNRNELEDVRVRYECEIHRLKSEIEAITADSSNSIRDLNKRVEEIHMNKDQQINSLILEYEKQLQFAHAQAMQMRNEYKILSDKNRLNISAYKERIEELERNNIVENKLHKTESNLSTTFPENIMFENEKSFNTSKPRKSFHILNKNETEVEEIQSSCNLKSTLKVVKRKLFNKDMNFLED